MSEKTQIRADYINFHALGKILDSGEIMEEEKEVEENKPLEEKVVEVFSWMRDTIEVIRASGLDFMIDGFDPEEVYVKMDEVENLFMVGGVFSPVAPQAMGQVKEVFWQVGVSGSRSKDWIVRYDNMHKYTKTVIEEGFLYNPQTWTDRAHGDKKSFADYSCDCPSYIMGNHEKNGRYCKHILLVQDLARIPTAQRTQGWVSVNRMTPKNWGEPLEHAVPVTRERS